MKKFLIMLLAGITLCMSACQQTPENPVVISKNDGMLESSINGDAVPLGKYNAPETWQKEIDGKDGLLKIRINANISVPDVDSYPVYSVTPSVIDDESVNNFINACVKNEQLYKVGNMRTKYVIMQEILKIQSNFDNPNFMLNRQLNSGEITQEIYDEAKKQYEMKISELQVEYNTAPDEVETNKIDNIEFETMTIGDGVAGYSKWLKFECMSKDLNKYILVEKDLAKDGEYGNAIIQSKLFKSNYNERGGYYETRSRNVSKNSFDIPELKISYEQAKKIADNFVETYIKYSQWSMAVSCHESYLPYPYDLEDWYGTMQKENTDKPKRYVFVYTQKINDIPVLFYTYNGENVWNVPKLWEQQSL